MDTSPLEAQLSIHAVRNAGLFYGRFSCDQSQQTSIADQLTVSLEYAADEGWFVPFDLVFADFAISGLTDDRPVFDGVRHVLRTSGPGISRLYVAEIHRASRDNRDSEDLFFLARKHEKVLKSASDGFDSSRPDAHVTLLRESVTSVEEKARRVALIRRGRHGALKRGMSLGSPPPGYTRRPALHPDGEPHTRRNGQPIYEWAIDPVTRVIVELIYDCFVVRHWSLRTVALHLNQTRANDSTSWTAGAIKRLLLNETYVGVLFRDRFSYHRDFETGKWRHTPRPRSEQRIVFMPHLTFVPPDLFKRARRRLADLHRASKLTGRKWTRRERNPKTPFDGLLYCACCEGNAITRSRSGNYPQYASVNGQNGLNGCQLTASKCVRQVEDALAGWLQDTLLTDDMARFPVTLANERLNEAARRQLPDPDVVRRRREKRRQRIQNLLDTLKDTTSSSFRNLLSKEIEQEDRLLMADNRELEEILTNRKTDLVRLDLGDAQRAFSDLRRLLSEEVPRAAQMLRELLGPIRIRQEPCDDRAGKYRWIATFQPRWSNTVAKLVPAEVVAGVHPLVGELGEPVSVVIDKIPLYQTLAPQIAALHEQSLTKTEIARRIGKSITVVTDALNFHYNGVVRLPRSQRPERKIKPRLSDLQYKDIADQVLQLRDVEHQSFAQIANHFNVSRGLVKRAYDFAHRQAAEAGVEVAPPLQRAAQLSKDVHDVIRALADSELTTAEIARRANCSHQTATRCRKKFRKRAA